MATTSAMIARTRLSKAQGIMAIDRPYTRVMGTCIEIVCIADASSGWDMKSFGHGHGHVHKAESLEDGIRRVFEVHRTLTSISWLVKGNLP